MSDRKAFEELSSTITEEIMEEELKSRNITSVKSVCIFEHKEKVKWFIFSYTQCTTIIQFVVDENLFVMESLINDIDLEEFANEFVPEYKCEIDYI